MANFGAPDFTKISLDSSIIPAVDQTFGLQGVKLDTPLANIEGLEFLEQRGDIQVYTRPSDSLQVGLAVADHIEYCFTDQRLSTIFIGFSDETTGIHIRNVFSKVYGRGFGTDKLVAWKGRRSEVIYTVKDKGEGYLAFMLTATPNEGMVRIKDLVDGTPHEIETILGPAESIEKVSPSSTPCEENPCNKASYQSGKYEIVFINGKADWVTINDVSHLILNDDVIEYIGLPPAKPTFSNPPIVLSWRNIAGLQEVSFFNNGSDRVGHIQIKATTK